MNEDLETNFILLLEKATEDKSLFELGWNY